MLDTTNNPYKHMHELYRTIQNNTLSLKISSLAVSITTMKVSWHILPPQGSAPLQS